MVRLPGEEAAAGDAVAERATPSVHPRPGLPPSVQVYEVGPRDGLQAEAAIVPTPVKVEFVRRLVDAGLTAVEATSFVSPAWVPQLADGADVLSGLVLDGPVRHPVLVPNERGLDRALEAGAREVAVFVSATETFARRNLNRTRDEAIVMAEPVVRRARDASMPVRGYVSMCWGDPWEGVVDPVQVASVARRLLDLGCTTISLGDTIGTGTPGAVDAVLAACETAGVPVGRLALHFHDTYGQALANVTAGLAAGVTEFDSSAGGIGGCPFAHSATGNLATEDLVWLLTGLGITTGVDLAALVDTSVWMSRHLGRPSPSRVVTALNGSLA